jgi:SAM-dependent methyltransferase
MSTSNQPITFTHAMRIAGYSWPLYAAAGLSVVVAVIILLLPASPLFLRWIAGLGSIIALWFAFASFWAFHWMFDRSELLGGQWLREEFPQAPRRWIQINAGLEETTLPLDQVFPKAEGKMLDLYDPAVMTEPAVTRARKLHPLTLPSPPEGEGTAASVMTQPDSLPVEDGWADVVVVTLAAHEIRNRQTRRRFFQELHRVVSPGGKLIVVEHLRDLAAALAFGPGILHFFPRQEWLRLGSVAGLKMEHERRITPFVRVFVYQPL